MFLRLLIFAITMLALSGICNGQSATNIYTGSVNQNTIERGGMASDSVFTMPVRDTTSKWSNWRVMGRMTLRPQDSTVYYHNGQRWAAVGSGSGIDSATLADSLARKQDTLGFTPPFIFNVLDYGANANDTLDDTEAIQAAINAALGIIATQVDDTTITWVDDTTRLGAGGVIYFPAPTVAGRKYLLKGEKIKSVNSHTVNCQLYIPLKSWTVDSNKTERWLQFRSEIQAPYLESNYVKIHPDLWDNAVYIESTLMYDSSLFPAVIGVEGSDTSHAINFPTYTNKINLTFKNVHLKVQFDSSLGGAQMCGVDALNAQDTEFEGSGITTTSYGFGNKVTTNPVFGFRCPSPYTGVVSVFRSGLISQFYDGIVAGEHTNIMNAMNIYFCYNAINQMINAHPTVLEYPTVQWCVNTIATGGYGIYSAQPVASGSDKAFITGAVKVELFCSGNYAKVYDINDNANILIGQLEFWNLRAGCFPSIFAADVVKNGGAGVTAETINQQSVNKRNFGKIFSGTDTVRVTYEVRNTQRLSSAGLWVSSGSTYIRYGGIQQHGDSFSYNPIFSAPFLGKSRDGKMILFSDGSQSTGMGIGTLTNDTTTLGAFNTRILDMLPTGAGMMYGMLSYNINRAGSYTSRSLVDKGYVDSVVSAGGTSYTFSTGLTNTSSTITNNVVTGVSGGQTWNGGTAANDDVTIHGTSNATRTTSYVLLNPTAGNVGINTTAPGAALQVGETSGTSTIGLVKNIAASGSYQAYWAAQSNAGQFNYGKNSTAQSYKISNGGDGFMYNSTNNIAILNDAATGTIKMTTGGRSTVDLTILANGRILLTQVPEYTDNAAAITAGLAVGTVYRTGDDMKIVH